MSLLIHLLMLATADPGVAASKARTPAPLQSLIRSEDYPQVAMQRGEQGTVSVLLDISPEGIVSRCSISVSSGSASLDEQTCAIFRARARFEPARDRDGHATVDQVSQRVTWRLVPAVPMSRQPWMIRVTIGLNDQGVPVSCETESVGTPEYPGCESIVGIREAVAAERGVGKANTIIAHTVNEAYFYPVPSSAAPDPKSSSAEAAVGAFVGEVVIEADGSISACKILSSDVPPEADFCGLTMTHNRFEPSEGAKPLTGTVRSYLFVRETEIN